MMLKHVWMVVKHLLAMTLVLRWLPLLVMDALGCLNPCRKLVVNSVDAKCSVKFRIAINVRMPVLNT
jgi:hypothetical protein